ncbi:MAG TPA: response regulator [Elusimicrobiota bacterium]|nr:response regulator [Elusimicrobiota bacterium]
MASSPKRLLIVDDEEDLLFMLSLAARREGRFVVETARDAEEGLAKALSFRPDIAVIDALMPDVDGFELCRRLRKQEDTKSLPIVILSASEPVRCSALSSAAGADGYVPKPYDQSALLELLGALSQGGKKA